MITPELIVEIRRLFYAEHFRVGTIAQNLALHHETVTRALSTDQFHRPRSAERRSLLTPYLGFLQKTLERYPRLRATRLYQMLVERGYTGSVVQLRRVVAPMRPTTREAFLSLHMFAGEQGQVDWASFGKVKIGRAERALSCFVMTLSHSRALFFEFFFDQTLASFLQGHVDAFDDLGGAPRVLLVDNLASAVSERRGEAIRFHPGYLELLAHYHTVARPCAVRRGNEKGRVERAIQYIRHSFFAARPFTTLQDFNHKALIWRDEVAHKRPWPGDDKRLVEEVFAEEKPRLLSLPAHPFETDRTEQVVARKIPLVRFDLNDYSIPHEAVGKMLTVRATRESLRVFLGPVQIASHKRSWDRHQLIEDPAHRKALLQEKRRAASHTPQTRLSRAVPATEPFLKAALVKGACVGRETRRLLTLLDEYGPAELQAALKEALRRGSPLVPSVQLLLETRRRARKKPRPFPVDLDDRPDLLALDVKPHDLETYDALACDDDDD